MFHRRRVGTRWPRWPWAQRLPLHSRRGSTSAAVAAASYLHGLPNGETASEAPFHHAAGRRRRANRFGPSDCSGARADATPRSFERQPCRQLTRIRATASTRRPVRTVQLDSAASTDSRRPVEGTESIGCILSPPPISVGPRRRSGLASTLNKVYALRDDSRAWVATVEDSGFRRRTVKSSGGRRIPAGRRPVATTRHD